MRQQRKPSIHTQAERKSKYDIMKSTRVLTAEKLSLLSLAPPQAHCVTKLITTNFSDPLCECTTILGLAEAAGTAVAAANHPIHALARSYLARSRVIKAGRKDHFVFRLFRLPASPAISLSH